MTDLETYTYSCGGIDVRRDGEHPDRCPYCYGPYDDPDLDFEAMREYVAENPDGALLYFNDVGTDIEWFAAYVGSSLPWSLVAGHDSDLGDEGDDKYIRNAIGVYDDVRVLERDRIGDEILERFDRVVVA